MAILKKKMAGKPAMMKKRKAQGGITLAKNPDTDEKNALDFVGKNKELGNVTKKEGFGESMKRFYKSDPAKADQAKTKVGKIARKALNTVTKVAFTPARAAFSASGAVDKAMTERKDKKAMKMGGKVKKYQAGGVVGKQPKAGMVDPKGAFTKVQERTIAGKKKK